MDDLVAAGGRRSSPLDVRENVRFRGAGTWPRGCTSATRRTGCCLAIEFKKIFMDEWTGGATTTTCVERRPRLGARRRRRSCWASALCGARHDARPFVGVRTWRSTTRWRDIARDFRFLLDVTPVDRRRRTARFDGARSTAEFRYRALEDDPAVVTHDSTASTVERRSRTRPWPACSGQAARAGAPARDAAGRETRDDFLALSIELYGACQPDAARRGRAILDRRHRHRAAERTVARCRGVRWPRRSRARPLPRAGPDLAVARRGARGQHRGDGLERRPAHRRRRPQCPSRGSTPCSSTRSAPTSSPTSTAPTSRSTCSAVGLAGHEETQEGLAVLAEYLSGV